MEQKERCCGDNSAMRGGEKSCKFLQHVELEAQLAGARPRRRLLDVANGGAESFYRRAKKLRPATAKAAIGQPCRPRRRPPMLQLAELKASTSELKSYGWRQKSCITRSCNRQCTMAGDGVHRMLRAATRGRCNDQNKMLERSIQKSSTDKKESYYRGSCYNPATTECCRGSFNRRHKKHQPRRHMPGLATANTKKATTDVPKSSNHDNGC